MSKKIDNIKELKVMDKVIISRFNTEDGKVYKSEFVIENSKNDLMDFIAFESAEFAGSDEELLIDVKHHYNKDYKLDIFTTDIFNHHHIWTLDTQLNGRLFTPEQMKEITISSSHIETIAFFK